MKYYTILYYDCEALIKKYVSNYILIFGNVLEIWNQITKYGKRSLLKSKSGSHGEKNPLSK